MAEGRRQVQPLSETCGTRLGDPRAPARGTRSVFLCPYPGQVTQHTGGREPFGQSLQRDVEAGSECLCGPPQRLWYTVGGLLWGGHKLWGITVGGDNKHGRLLSFTWNAGSFFLGKEC